MSREGTQAQEEKPQISENEVGTESECDEVLRERVCSAIRELDTAIGRPPFPNPCTATSLNAVCKVEKMLRSLAECKRTHILRNTCPEVMQTLPLLCAALPQGSVTVNSPCIQLYETLLSSLCHVLSITNYQKDKIVSDALSILSLKSSSTLICLLHAANALTPSLMEQILFADKCCNKNNTNKNNKSKTTNSTKNSKTEASITLITTTTSLAKKQISSNSKMNKTTNHNNKKCLKSKLEDTNSSQVHVEQSEQSIKAERCNNEETMKPSLDVIHTLLDLPLNAPCKAVLFRLFNSNDSFTELVHNDEQLALHIMSKYGNQLINKLHPFTFLECLNSSLLPYLVSAFQSHGSLSDISHVTEWEGKVEQWSLTLLDNLCHNLHDINIKNSNARGLLLTATLLLHVIHNKQSTVKLLATVSDNTITNNTVDMEKLMGEIEIDGEVKLEDNEHNTIVYLRMLLWESVIRSSMHIMKSATNNSKSDNATTKKGNTEEYCTEVESQQVKQTSLPIVSASSSPTEANQKFCSSSSSNNCVFDESTLECMTMLAHVANHEITNTILYLLTAEKADKQKDKCWISLNKSADAFYKNRLEPLCRVLTEACTKQHLNKETNTFSSTIAMNEPQERNNEVKSCTETEQLLNLPLQCTQITSWLLMMCNNIEYKYMCTVHMCKLLCECMKISDKSNRSIKPRVLNSAQEELSSSNGILPNIYNIQQEQWCNRNMWNALLDNITIWGWRLWQSCAHTKNAKRISAKQLELCLEEIKQFICEENVGTVLCAAVRDTGRVTWLSPLLFLLLELLLLPSETTQTKQADCTVWVHTLKATFLFYIVNSLTKLNVQDAYDKQNWWCSIAPLTREEVIGVLLSYLTRDQLHHVAIEIIKRKLGTILLHILEQVAQELKNKSSSDYVDTNPEESGSISREQQQTCKRVNTFSGWVKTETLAEKCLLGFDLFSSCLREEIDLSEQRTKEANEKQDAVRAEQLLEHVNKATELHEDKELFDKMLQEKAIAKQQEEMRIRTELARRNTEKEEKRIASKLESEARVREMMERIKKEQEEKKEERKREQRRRLELYQKKMLNNFNVVTFLEHLELTASRKWYVQETIAHHCTEISPDDLLEFIVTGNMKVPEDMCAEADNDALVENCDNNNNDNAVIADSALSSNNNQVNNDKTITDNKVCSSTQSNEEMKKRECLTRMLKRNVNQEGKYDLWQVVMNDNSHEQNANHTQMQSQLAMRWKDDGVHYHSTNSNDGILDNGDNQSSDAGTMHHSFHYRVTFVLNLFSYEGGNEYGNLPEPLPSINVSLAHKVINQESLKESGYKHLLEAFRSLERRELVSFDSNCTNVSLTKLGFRYHFPFHDADFALCTQLEVRKAQIQSILQNKSQSESYHDKDAVSETNSDANNTSMCDDENDINTSDINDHSSTQSSSDDDADSIAGDVKKESTRSANNTTHAFLPEVMFDIESLTREISFMKFA